MSQAELRKQMLARRRALGASALNAKGEALSRRFLDLHKRNLNCARVALYQALPGEPSLAHLEAELRRQGARLYFPRIAADRRLELVEMTHPPVWQDGPYGISEPHADLPGADDAELARIDVVIVPGAAFGLRGERVGMGGGYYDRLLPKLPRALKVALTLDFQLLDSIPQNAWDQPVDWVITEDREAKP